MRFTNQALKGIDMIIGYQNLLVILDLERETQPVLARAASIAQQVGARITVMLIISELSHESYALLSPDETLSMRETLIAEREEFIRDHLRPYLDLGLQIDINVSYDDHPIAAIQRQIRVHHHDLIIKTAKPLSLLDKVIFTPFDWQLLRKCSCPIWLVSEKVWNEKQTALVAVNLGSGDPFHQVINQQMLATCQWLVSKQVLDSKINLINAYAFMPITPTVDCPDSVEEPTDEPSRAHCCQEMVALQQQFQLPMDKCVVEPGPAEVVIPIMATKLNVGLVILGSRARRGIAALLLGNTAELMIESLQSDLLIIRLPNH